MRTGCLVVALLLYLTLATSGQQDSKSARSADSGSHESQSARKYSGLGGTPEEFGKAVGFSQLILSSDQKQYFVVPKSTVDAGSPGTPFLWSYGDKALNSKDSTAVAIQLGTKDNKPVYLPVWVSKDQAETASKSLRKLIDDAHWPDESQVQRCSDGRECVRTCPDGKGGTYCCQWKCKFGK